VVIPKQFAFLAAGLAVVAALWSFFKPERAQPQAADSARTAGASAPAAMGAPTDAEGQGTQARAPRQDVFDLVIKGGKPVAGPVLLQVHEGEQVTLNIRSDSMDELHLHGYDLHAHIGPEQTATLHFSASRTGRFGLELHKARTELGALEVYPQ
jgi:hypothetical protein